MYLSGESLICVDPRESQSANAVPLPLVHKAVESEALSMEPLSEIWLVDDNVADVYLASEALRMNSESCPIASVRDGAEALAYLRHEGQYSISVCPNVVILDLRLPKKSGESVLAELKADPALRKIPVVIFSTSRSNKDIVRSYQLGATCYLSKPVNLSEFVSTVQLIGSFFGGNVSAKGEKWNDQKRVCC